MRYVPSGGPVEQAEDIQKGALAGAAGADDGYVLTRLDGKRDVIESMQRGPADVVGPGYVANFDEGRWASHRPRPCYYFGDTAQGKPGLGASNGYGGSGGYCPFPLGIMSQSNAPDMIPAQTHFGLNVTCGK